MEYTQAELDGEFNRLLSQEYQRQQSRSILHTHVCEGCGARLTCCCEDRRGKDRLTGALRSFYCLACQEDRQEPSW
jgi:hypothetical protein